MFEYALRIAGFSVAAAADGLVALRMIDQHFLPDAIVLDLDLPQVSGIDVQQEVVSHADTRDIPIIVVTGTGWRPPAGVFRTLRKPIASDVVVAAVQEALARQHEPAAGNDAQIRPRDE